MPTEYEAFFKEADTDGSGELTFDELYKVLTKKGYKGSESQIRAYFRQVDTSGDGQICWKEYQIAMGLIPETDHKKAAMRNVFNSFDKDGSGEIDRHELKQVFQEMHKYFPDDQIKRMIALADKNGDGLLNFEEFIEQVFGVTS